MQQFRRITRYRKAFDVLAGLPLAGRIRENLHRKMHNSGWAVVVSVETRFHIKDELLEMPQTAWLGNLYQQYRRELFLAAWTVLRQVELSEDAVHAAFVKLVILDSEPSDPKLYVLRCVRNAALDLAKARSRRREEPMQADWDRPSPETDVPDVEVLRSITELLERLDDSSREVIELHLHAALTFEEIAQMLGEPLPTIASRYRRALDKLGKQIKVRHE